MRKLKFTAGEYYHIYNRGNDKKQIFFTKADYARFLFLILYFQAPIPIRNISRQITHFMRHSAFDNDLIAIKEILRERNVEVVSFTLMPNHFHCLVRALSDEGVSQYMQRVLDAYTKYFNTKNEKNGHVFQGPFQAVPVETNEQLLYVSAYIHRNQRELPKWKNKEYLYLWSSYQDYVHKNRWGELLKTSRILEQFSSPDEYQKLVETSGAKEKKVLKKNTFF